MSNVTASSLMSAVSETSNLETDRKGDLALWLTRGCACVALLIPLKLSWTYVALIPLVITWIVHAFRTKFNLARIIELAPPLAPLCFFLVALTVGALAGMNVGHSLSPLLSLLFYTATLLTFLEYGSPATVFPALVLGQSIAALHSVIDASFPDVIPALFIGKVTESGQLALTFPIALGLAWQQSTRLPLAALRRKSRVVYLGVAATLILAFVGFRADLNMSPNVAWAAWLLIAVVFAIAFCVAKRGDADWRRYVCLVSAQLPLLMGALLVNLKRGPWSGVAVGSLVFFSIFAPRFLRWIVGSAVLLAVAITPIRDRLASSYDHFVITGGRSTIWRIGAELTAKYPLGIGFHNSEILRRFAPEIPPELRHFHNNLLNITAENGWLAAGIFIWFIVSLLRTCFRKPLDPLYVAIGCALISWQVAGLVEYNVGDSEVMLIVWLTVGILCGSSRIALPGGEMGAQSGAETRP
jgi:hypothetical protein